MKEFYLLTIVCAILNTDTHVSTRQDGASMCWCDEIAFPKNSHLLIRLPP